MLQMRKLSPRAVKKMTPKSHGSKKRVRIGTQLVFKIYMARPLQAALIRHVCHCMVSSP